MQKSRGNLIITGPSRLAREGLKPALRKWQFIVRGEGKDLIEAQHQIDPAIVPDAVICILTGGEDIEHAVAQLGQARDHYPDVKCVIVADTLSSGDVLRALRAGVDAILSPDISARLLLNSLELVLLGQQLFPALPIELLTEAADLPAAPARLCLTQALDGVPSDIVVGGDHPTATGDDLLPAHLRRSPTPLSDAQSTGIRAMTGAGPLVLSDRESQILRCLVNGHSNKVIARQLGIAETTVKVHIKGLLRKVRATNRTQAAIWALNNCFSHMRE